MIVLDSNVLSALMRPHRHEEIRDWMDSQPDSSLWTTSINLLEVRGGVLLLPDGRRKQLLLESLDLVTSRVLRGRILPFDVEAAMRSAEIYAVRQRKGINRETRDTQIAGIVMSRKASLATRNLRDFDDLDIPLVDPWAA